MRTGKHCLTPLAAVAGGVLAGVVGTVCLDAVQYLRYRRAGGTESPLAWEFAPVRTWEQAPDPGQVARRIVSGASTVTDGMLLAAAEAVAGQADVSAPGASLLPAVENLRASSATTAIAVARAAADDGVATRKADDLVQAVQDAIWQPAYPDSVS
jgi:hypothetical protein